MPSEHQLQLLRLIESQVLPRLFQSLGGADSAGSPESERFAQVLSKGDPALIDEYMRSLIESGIPLRSIFLRVLAPAARHLCDRWERRECSFHEVATGLIQLLSVLRRLRESPH